MTIVYHNIPRERSSPDYNLSESGFTHKVIETYGTQILLLAVGVATTIVVTRALGPEGRGLYAVMIATGRLGSQFCNLGLHVSNTYYVAKNPRLLPSLLANALGVSVLVGGLCAAATAGVFHCAPDIAPLHGTLLTLTLLWIPFGLAYLLMQNLLLALLQVRSYNIIEIVNRTGYLAIIVLLVALHSLSVQTAFISTLILLVASLVWAIWRLTDYVGTKLPALSFALFKDNFSLGFRGYLISLLGFMVLRIDLLMVKYMLGTVQAGYYSVAAGIADYVLLLPTVVASILFPKLSASSDLTAKWRFAKRATLATGAILLPIAVIVVCGSGPIITAVFGVAFAPAAVALRWLAPGIVALGLQVVMVQYLNSVGYPALLVAAWSTCTVLNVGLNWWAIPAYGIMGASLVSSISYSLMCMLVLLIIVTGTYGQKATALKVVAVES